MAKKSNTSASADKKKRAKKVKDPNAPKKPANSYLLFTMDIRADIIKKEPELKATEVMKKCAEMWKNIDKEKKEFYEKKCTEMKKVYEKEKKAYDEKVAAAA